MEMRRATRPEVDVLIDWAANEGWNPGVHDAEAFWRADHEGFYVSLLNGEMVAGISVVGCSDQEPTAGFLGLYIVHPDHRGKGYGKALWDFALSQAPYALIGLDGVVASQKNYESEGFEYLYPQYRYHGVRLPGYRDPLLHPLGLAVIPDYVALEHEVTGLHRPQFVRAWVESRGLEGDVLVDDLGATAIGAIRPCRQGYKIGPLYANNPDQARLVLDGLLSYANGRDVYWDIPGPNTAAREIAESLGMTPMFETARMWRGGVPPHRVESIYGVTTFELG